MRSLSRCLSLAVLALSLARAPAARSEGLYSQLVVPFPSERAVAHEYIKSENALVLAFKGTAPSELGAFDRYDERLVKRVVMKDLGPAGTEVKLVLRDRKVRAVVSEFTEPYRVAIDLFDADYEEAHDPTTGMPLAGTAKAPSSAQAANDGDGGSADDGMMPAAGKLMLPEDGATEAGAPAGGAGQAPAGKRMLLQPPPASIESEGDLREALQGTPQGPGKAWATFPPYIYRLQTAPYEAGMAKKSSSPPALAGATASSAALAAYAGKLFDFGDEARALVVYQQVLHKDPTLFDRDALHLWKLAECQLGQGNLGLATGYYQAISEKHPESPLAAFAKMRELDVRAVRLISQEKGSDLPTLLPGLDAIGARHVGELQAQLAIRRAYWSPAAEKTAGADGTNVRAGLPRIDGNVQSDLTAAYPNAESARTAFLTASLILNDMVRPDTAWSRSTGPFAEAYFKRFSGAPTEAYRVALRDQLQAKLNRSLQSKVADGKLVEAIDDYEALPKSLRGISRTPATAWALAEAYRKLSQGDKAIELYQTAAKSAEPGPERFKALFWLSITSGELAAQLGSNNAARAGKLRDTSREADRRAGAAWDSLKPEEQKAIAVAYKEPIEKAVTSGAKLRTPPRIALTSWTTALATPAAAASGGEPNDWQRQFSPSGSAVILMTDLAKRFSELGMSKERRQALGLLKSMKPAQFEDDKAARDIWARELLKLAEDYRTASEYLEAGRLYSLVGAESENWEGRAEALYKGALLLYRGGRRAEAIEAFKKAADDGNNLFYANLAKERLAQLE